MFQVQVVSWDENLNQLTHDIYNVQSTASDDKHKSTTTSALFKDKDESKSYLTRTTSLILSGKLMQVIVCQPINRSVPVLVLLTTSNVLVIFLYFNLD